jgi:hypothetical protein
VFTFSKLKQFEFYTISYYLNKVPKNNILVDCNGKKPLEIEQEKKIQLHWANEISSKCK